MTLEAMTACDLCGSREARVVSADSATEHALVQCARCRHLYLHPFPTPAYLAQAYAEELSVNDSPQARINQASLWARRYRSVKGFLGPDRGRLLDVGCGEGVFLHEAQQDGWTGFGTEYHDAAARYARDQYGLTVVGGDLLAAKFPDAQFDAITLWHVLEHLYSPSAYLRDIRRLLKPGGRLIIECPHVEPEAVRPGIQFGYRKLHLHFFSREAMERLLRQTGFTVRGTSYEDPDAYRPVWSSILHHVTVTAWIQFANRFRAVPLGSTIRAYAVKEGA